MPWLTVVGVVAGAVLAHLRCAGAQPERASFDPVILGSSLSVTADPNAPPANNLSNHGLLLGDELARLYRMPTDEGPPVLIEINPFFFDERFALNVPRFQNFVSLENESAMTIALRAPRALASEALRQLGLEGALSEAVAGFGPNDWRRNGPQAKARKTSLEWLLNGKVVTTAKKPDARDIACQNFGAKASSGTDDVILAEILRIAGGARRRMAVFVPPMNRQLIGSCGDVPLANLDALITKLRTAAAARGVLFFDESHAYDDKPEVFIDYGHLKRSVLPGWALALPLQNDSLNAVRR